MVTHALIPGKFKNSIEFNKVLMAVHACLTDEESVRACMRTEGW